MSCPFAHVCIGCRWDIGCSSDYNLRCTDYSLKKHIPADGRGRDRLYSYSHRLPQGRPKLLLHYHHEHPWDSPSHLAYSLRLQRQGAEGRKQLLTSFIQLFVLLFFSISGVRRDREDRYSGRLKFWLVHILYELNDWVVSVLERKKVDKWKLIYDITISLNLYYCINWGIMYIVLKQ